MKTFLALVLALSSNAFAQNEYVCTQNFTKETGWVVFDASELFVRVKATEDGKFLCAVGETGGAWSGVEIYSEGECSFKDEANAQKVELADSFSISISNKAETRRDGAQVFTAKGTVKTLDEETKKVSDEAHIFDCQIADAQQKGYSTWSKSPKAKSQD